MMEESQQVEVKIPDGLSPDVRRKAQRAVEDVIVSLQIPAGTEIILCVPAGDGEDPDETHAIVRVRIKML